MDATSRIKPSVSEAVFLASIARTHPRARGMRAWYLFEENGGQVAFDLSGFGHHLDTWTNMSPATNWTTDRYGHGVTLPGSGSQVMQPTRHSGLNNLPVFTIATHGLIRDAGQFGLGILFNKGENQDSGWYIQTEDGGSRYNFGVKYTTTGLTRTTTAAPTYNAWQWVVLRYAGGDVATDLTLWEAGLEAEYANSTNGTGGRIDESAHPLYLGNWAAFSRTSNALFSCVRVQEALLAPEEIVSLETDPWREWNWAREQLRQTGWGKAPAAAGGLSIPLAMYHYQHNTGSHL